MFLIPVSEDIPLDRKNAIRLIRAMLARPPKNQRPSLAARVADMRVDSNNLTMREAFEIVASEEEDQSPLADFETTLENCPPEAHITFFGAADVEEGELPYQCEVLSDATDWKTVRLGDNSLAGLLQQISEF